MPPNGNFYKFVEMIQKEERDKFYDFQQLLSGNTNVFSPKRKRLNRRDKLIRNNQLKLDTGRLNVEAFLEVLAYPGNKAVVNMADGADAYIPESEGELDDDLTPVVDEEAVRYEQLLTKLEVVQNQLLEERRTNGLMSCVLCFENLRTRCMLPCRHLVACEQCSLTLIANETSDALCYCPICRAEVTEVQEQYL